MSRLLYKNEVFDRLLKDHSHNSYWRNFIDTDIQPSELEMKATSVSIEM